MRLNIEQVELRGSHCKQIETTIRLFKEVFDYIHDIFGLNGVGSVLKRFP